MFIYWFRKEASFFIESTLTNVNIVLHYKLMITFVNIKTEVFLMTQILTIIIALALIVAILWWFFGKNTTEAGHSEIKNGQQESTVVVKGGYSPSTVILKKGVPAKLKFDMQDSTACLSHIVFDSLGVDKDLTKQRFTEVEIPTDKAGEINFACGMDMFHGKVVVK